jgi:CDP-glycerol glycerophosphotransferase
MLRLISLLFSNAAYLLACLIPKDENLWIFSAWNGKKFNDNPKYLFEHVEKTAKSLSTLWATKDQDLYKTLVDTGIPAFYVYSLKGIWIQARAGVAVYTHALDWEFCSPCIGRKTRRIQLWHGMPLKKIGLDDKKNVPSRTKRLIGKILFPYRSERFDLIIAASQIDKEIYQSAFAAHADAVRITGFPRNDVLTGVGTTKVNGNEKSILYVPTFRGRPGSEFTLLAETAFDYNSIDHWLATRNLRLHIKLHPVNYFSNTELAKIRACSRISLIENKGDIYETLGKFDIFITDFSSIYFDLLITCKPIIVAPLGLSQYLAEDREGFYFDYHELAPHGVCNTWADILEQIERYRVLTSPTDSYYALQRKFHHYLDNGSSERVYQEILKLLNR